MDGLFGDIDSAVDDAIDSEREEAEADPDRAPPPVPSRARRRRNSVVESASRTVATQAAAIAKKAKKSAPLVPALAAGAVSAALMTAGLWGSRRIERGKNEKLLELDAATIVPVAAAGAGVAILVYLGLKARDYVRGDDDAPTETANGVFADNASGATAESPTGNGAPKDELEAALAGLLAA